MTAPWFAAITFEFPLAWQVGLPLAAAVLLLNARAQLRRGLTRRQLAGLTTLRAVLLLVLLFLASRPIWTVKEQAGTHQRSVVLLLDRSESMSLQENDASRYERALGFAREHLLPALRSAKLDVDPFLFAQEVEPADGPALAAAQPDGKRTNLPGAIARAINAKPVPPLAVIALTDGAINESSENARALTALADGRVPLVAVGFGSDLGAQTLSLREVDAPPVVAPNTAFHVSAQLETVGTDELPPFDLVLFRDGQMAERKTVEPGKGSRTWLESFRVTEKEVGAHEYAVQFLPPQISGLKCVNNKGSVPVRITNERELRILYVQGALTWDYKFVALALHGDPAMKLTGLTRTSKQSVFRQNVETAGELVHGFPTTIEEIAPFRVIVLSNLKPADLTPPQQELLARFCGELGGGLLMIGGSDTFDASWKRSRLEQLLPVVFASGQGVRGLDRPFRLVLTDEALQHPVFQIEDRPTAREVWNQLPPFTQYGRVDAAKPGAHVWARHHQDDGPEGKRILIAWQRYGAGISAVIAVQNLWRWRLAKDTDPQMVDRFWRQLFRFISESSRQDVTISLADQELRPQMDVQVFLERQPKPNALAETNSTFVVRIERDQGTKIREQQLELPAGIPVDVFFRAETSGVYTVTVEDRQKQAVATRSIEIRDLNLEFQNTGRNMETLRQWASVSDGLALKAEDCRDGAELVSQIQRKVEDARRTRPLRKPVGINVWTLCAVLGCLGGEWLLRKRWGLL